MKRFFGLLVGAFVTLAAWQAEAAPVNIVDFGGTAVTTGTASAGCTQGQVAAIMATAENGFTPTGAHDSAGGTFTISPAIFHETGGTTFMSAVFGKRVVGAGNQITTSTTFTLDGSGTPAGVVIEVYCIADGTGIPTSTDASNNTGNSLTAPAPTLSTSYQFGVVSSYGGAGATISTGGGVWTIGAAHTSGNANISVSWRKSGGTAAFSWTGTIGGFDGAAFSEVSTSGAAAKPHTLTTLGAG